MKLLVIGATGPTGQLLVSEALDRGHSVTALVRNAEKLTIKNEKLQVIVGDILSTEDMATHMKGCDAVLSSVGARPALFAPCDVYSRSAKVTVDAMRQTGVNRFMAITAWGTKDDPGLPFIWRWIMKPTFMRNICIDMDKAETFLSTECSDINFTVFRPPRLMKEPSEGGTVQVSEGQIVPGAVPEIRREDLAKFMLDCLNTTNYDRKLLAVTGPKK